MAIKDLLVHLDQTPASTARLRGGAGAGGWLRRAGHRALPGRRAVHARHGRAPHAGRDAPRAPGARRGRGRSGAGRGAGGGGPARGDPRGAARQRLPGPAAAPAGAPCPLRRPGRRRPGPTRGGGADDALLAEAAFMDSGRPALVIPRAGAAALPPRRALIAWDGSREAARAANDALPLLQLAERVVSWSSTADAGRPVDAARRRVAAHLTRHGVRAEVQAGRGRRRRHRRSSLLAQARGGGRRSPGHGRLRPLAPARDDAGRRHPPHARARHRAGPARALRDGQGAQ